MDILCSEQVMKLKAMLSRERGFGTQTFGGYTEISAEETVESTSEGVRGSNKARGKSNNIEHVADEGYCSFPVEDYNILSLPHCHWPVVPY